MVDELLLHLKPLLGRLEDLANTDAGVRAELRELGRTLLALGEEPVRFPGIAGVQVSLLSPAASPEMSSTVADNAPAPTCAETAPSEISISSVRIDPVRVDTVKVAVPPKPHVEHWPTAPPAAWSPVADEDLPLIAERCRLKADAARFAANRRRRIREGDDSFADFEIEYHDLIAQAKALPDCFLWMCRDEGQHGVAPTQFDDLAGCYEAAAHATNLAHRLVSSPDADAAHVKQALHLVAEAQSAIWQAIADMDQHPDADQRRLYDWLKGASNRRGVWLGRFMARTDAADPAAWSDLQARIMELESQLQADQARERQRRKLLGKIRHHVKRLTNAAEGTHEGTHDEDWQTIVRSIVELVQNGLPPSNVELRDLLLPVVDGLPAADNMPREVHWVLREIDRYLAESSSGPESRPVVPTEQIRRVGRLLRGSAVVLIGGTCRPGAKQALEDAFGLSELIWIEGHDQSYTLFAPQVARPDVAVVLLAIRWARHGFGEVKAYCDQHDKPLVRLPAGYNPNQVAHQILTQAGEQLAGTTGLVLK